MSTNPQHGDRLDSWKEIAAYVGRDVRTVIRWEQRGGLPVYRVPVGQRQAVYAYRREIDAWLSGGAVAFGPENQSDAIPLHSAWTKSAAAAAVSPPVQSGARRRLRSGPLVGAASATLLAVAILVWVRPGLNSSFRISGQTLLTEQSSALGDGIVAGGGNVYFSLWRGGRVELFALSESGGAAHPIDTPFLRNTPVAVTRDGAAVLVLAGVGQEKERPLWKVPTDGSQPTRVGGFLCHTAALSPDGSTLAWSYGNSLYLADSSGMTPHVAHTFGGVPLMLRWSVDGRRLLVLEADSAENSVIWSLSLDGRDRYTVDNLMRLTRARRRYVSLSPVIDQQDDVILTEGGDSVSAIYLLRSPHPRWTGTGAEQFLDTKANMFAGFALNTEQHRLYFGKSTAEETELDRYDTRTGEVRPFLPGVSAHDVDFSRDGRKIVYKTDSPASLWIARSDGAGARRMEVPGIFDIELPRWSPDGKTVAFMGKYPAKPWRIYIVPAAGGTVREASEGFDNQGAPTWSPDGHRLLYGRVVCQEENTCAVLSIDLNTGQEITIFGSEGLSTARWSPDGKYIAALRSDTRQVFLFDCATGAWRELADGINGNDLAWAPDSRAVYASRPDGDQPAILRIPLEGVPETVLDLRDFSRLAGRLDSWFTVAPDGSLIFIRLVSGSEIVALNYTGA